MKKIILMLLIIVIPFNGNSQVSKSSSSIKQLVDSIRLIVQKEHIPALMLGVATTDSVLYSGGFGYVDIKTKQAVNSKTLFRMGSITKSLIAIGILKLIEQGRLSLTDELKKIAPDVPFTNRWEATNPIRVVDLLENTTGFDDFKLNNMYSLDHEEKSTREMMFLQKNSMVCRWRPSERYTYCNVNYVILGYIIHVLTTDEYNQYLTKNILLPLGMNLSNFNLWRKSSDNSIKEYKTSSGQSEEIPSVTLLPGPAGSLWSSSDDMLKLLQCFLKNGFPLLQENSIQRMETPKNSLAARAGLRSGYGLGNEDFGPFRGHDGSLGTCKSSYRYNRKLGFGFVIASSNGNGLSRIERLISQYLLRDKPVDKRSSFIGNKQAIVPYLGYYQAEDPRFDILAFADRLMMLKIEYQHDTLFVNIFGKKQKLLQTAPFTFSQEGASEPTISFTMNADGRRVLIIGKHYCEQISKINAIGSRLLVLTVCLLMLLSIPYGLASIIAFFSNKLSLQILVINSLPMVSVLLLSWSTYSFLVVKDKSYLLYELREISMRSLSIYIGISLYSFLSIVNVYVLFNAAKKISSRLAKSYLLLTAISLLLISIFLFFNGWVGLRTWAM